MTTTVPTTNFIARYQALATRLPKLPSPLAQPAFAAKPTIRQPLRRDAFNRSTSKTAVTQQPAKTHAPQPKFGGIFSDSDLDDTPEVGPPAPFIKGEPPFEKLELDPVPAKHEQKIRTAQELGNWLVKKLDNPGNGEKVTAAVVARKGKPEVKKHDKTGMVHSGIVTFNDKSGNWDIYNLVNDKKQDYDDGPTASLLRTTPTDFFYHQSTSVEKDAMLLLPDTETQRRLKDSIQNGHYKRMFFTKDYNLVSPYDTQRSLNCNKWVLMTLLAAKHGMTEPKTVLEKIRKEFEPGIINVNPVVRPFAKNRPTIMPEEVPWWNNIETVTVESLHNHRGLFQDEIFHSGKTIKEVKQEPDSSWLPTAGYVAGAGLLAAASYVIQRRRHKLSRIF